MRVRERSILNARKCKQVTIQVGLAGASAPHILYTVPPQEGHRLRPAATGLTSCAGRLQKNLQQLRMKLLLGSNRGQLRTSTSWSRDTWQQALLHTWRKSGSPETPCPSNAEALRLRGPDLQAIDSTQRAGNCTSCQESCHSRIQALAPGSCSLRLTSRASPTAVD